MKQVARVRFDAQGAHVLDDGHHWVPANDQVVANELGPFIDKLPNLEPVVVTKPTKKKRSN